MNKQEFGRLIKDRDLVVGYNESLRAVKDKKADVVVVSSNCPKSHVESLGNVEVFDGSSKELGIALGKPFNISALTVVK